MKRQDGYYIETREIAFGRMLWCVLKKWRAILCIAVVCAVLAGAFRYQSDLRMHKASYEAALNKVEEAPLSIEELKARLNAEELAGVYRAIFFNKRAEVTTEYLDHSLLVHADPYAIDVNYLYYTPKGEDAESIAIEVEQYIFNEDFFRDLLEKTGWDIQTQHLWELFDYEFYKGQIKITIAADNADNSQFLTDLTMKILEEKFAGKIINGYAITDKVVDYSLVSTYNDIYDFSVKSGEIFANYWYHFTDTQRQLYEKMTADASDSDTENVTYEEPALEKTYLNKSMMLMGGLAGIIIGIVLFAVLFTFSGNIHGAEEVRFLYDEQIVGYVSGYDQKRKKWFGAIDHAIDYFASRENRISSEQQMALLQSNLYLKCKEQNIKKLYIAGSMIEKIPRELLESVANYLVSKDIKAVIGKNLLQDAEALLEAVELGNIVFIEIDESSNCKDIAKELNLCLEHQINQLGIILIQK